MKRQQRNTLILILVLVLLLGGGLVMQKCFFSRKGPTAVVRRGSETLAQLDLSKDAELRVELEGDYNLVQVQNGKVRVLEANCGDLTCVRTGWAEREGDVIACLPHGVIIYIEREEG